MLSVSQSRSSRSEAPAATAATASSTESTNTETDVLSVGRSRSPAMAATRLRPTRTNPAPLRAAASMTLAGVPSASTVSRHQATPWSASAIIRSGSPTNAAPAVAEPPVATGSTPAARQAATSASDGAASSNAVVPSRRLVSAHGSSTSPAGRTLKNVIMRSPSRGQCLWLFASGSSSAYGSSRLAHHQLMALRRTAHRRAAREPRSQAAESTPGDVASSAYPSSSEAASSIGNRAESIHSTSMYSG